MVCCPIFLPPYFCLNCRFSIFGSGFPLCGSFRISAVKIASSLVPFPKCYGLLPLVKGCSISRSPNVYGPCYDCYGCYGLFGTCSPPPHSLGFGVKLPCHKNIRTRAAKTSSLRQSKIGNRKCFGTSWDGLWDGLNIEITQCLCGLGRRYDLYGLVRGVRVW